MIVHMIGNAHIDPVWMWPWHTGVDEALANFASAADRCDEYPDFVFTRGEAWLYKQVETIHPDLFARVRKLIEQGQWRIVGGQFIQPDTNMPTEQGWRQQLRIGQRYFNDHFGVRPTIGYNVDSFGHVATLPDILAAHSYTGYVFRRPEPHQVELPANTFVWRGVNGGEVVAFRIIPGYVANFTDLYGQVMLAVENTDPAIGHTMCFYGVGNHGGGPTKAMIEWILEHKNAFDGIELHFSTPQMFFDAIADRRSELPVVTTELQRTFPGCYSVMHDVKREQRCGEQLLDQAERAIDHFAGNEQEKLTQMARIDEAWEDLLFTQFHDIITGTSIPSAWRSVRAMQGRARIIGEEVIVQTTRRWAYRTLPRVDNHQVVLLNTDTEPFDGFVEAEPYLDFDDWGDRWISELDGQPIEYQQIQPEAMQLIPRILFPVRVPPGAHTQLVVRNDPRTAKSAVETDLQAMPQGLSNERLTVSLGPTGISQITFDGEALLGPAGMGLHLRRDTTDTWTFHTDRWEEPIGATLRDAAWTVEERGPLRARARTEFDLGHSRIRWTADIYRHDPRMLMRLEVNFAERLTLLQLPIELIETPDGHADGLAGGHIDRPSSPTEWPMQGWSKLRVGGTDCAIVTNDAYSLSLNGALWQWTLLRSPKMAWGGGKPAVYAGHDWHTDQGHHEFAFELRLGKTLSENELALAVRRQAQPLVVLDRYEGMNRPSWGGVPPRGLWGPAMERNAADGRTADAAGRGTLHGLS